MSIDVSFECVSQEALLAKEEEELKGLRKLRGTDKVAARKAQAATEGSEDRARVAADAPTLHGRGLDAAIAVMTVAMGGAAVSGGGARGRGGAGEADEEEGGDAAAAEHARDVAAVARLASGVDEDDKHPEKRAKVRAGGERWDGRRRCVQAPLPSPLARHRRLSSASQTGSSSSSRRSTPRSSARSCR